MGCELNYMTYNFVHNHVYVKGSDERHAGKKEAEAAFQRRDVDTSTMLCLDGKDLRVLYAEVINRQTEYRAADSGNGRPTQIYTSQAAYAYYERTGKRAKPLGPAHFRYAVRKEGDMYKICHLDGMA